MKATSKGRTASRSMFQYVNYHRISKKENKSIPNEEKIESRWSCGHKALQALSCFFVCFFLFYRWKMILIQDSIRFFSFHVSIIKIISTSRWVDREKYTHLRKENCSILSKMDFLTHGTTKKCIKILLVLLNYGPLQGRIIIIEKCYTYLNRVTKFSLFYTNFAGNL